jgi:hypothetical protein
VEEPAVLSPSTRTPSKAPLNLVAQESQSFFFQGEVLVHSRERIAWICEPRNRLEGEALRYPTSREKRARCGAPGRWCGDRASTHSQD